MDFSQIDSASAADAAAGVLMSLPYLNKRDKEEGDLFQTSKKFKTLSGAPMTAYTPAIDVPAAKKFTTKEVKEETPSLSASKEKDNEKKTFPSVTAKTPTLSRKGRDPLTQRLTRLEQNRRAAKESRLRKNKMIAELQGSVTFFSRANATIKQQNEELLRLIIEAQEYVTADVSSMLKAASEKPKMEEKTTKMESESKKESTSESASVPLREAPQTTSQPEQCESERQCGIASSDGMATLQQAASVALQESHLAQQSADQVILPLYSPPPTVPWLGMNPQQSYADALYRDTLTALIMQQAAAAVAATAGSQQPLLYPGFPFMMGPLFAMQMQQQQQQQLQFFLQQSNASAADNETNSKNQETNDR